MCRTSTLGSGPPITTFRCETFVFRSQPRLLEYNNCPHCEGVKVGVELCIAPVFQFHVNLRRCLPFIVVKQLNNVCAVAIQYDHAAIVYPQCSWMVVFEVCPGAYRFLMIYGYRPRTHKPPSCSVLSVRVVRDDKLLLVELD